MVITGHYCPARGRSRLGHEADCPECRALLLEAFREPGDSDYRPANMPLEPEPWHPSLPRMSPGERVTAGLTALGRCSGCAHPEHSALYCSPECVCADGLPVLWSETAGHGRLVRHAVADLRWALRCSCGWRMDGNHLPGHADEAREICRKWAQAHLDVEHGQ